MDALRAYYDQVMRDCPESQWVLAGYSQGAMVVSEAAKSFRADHVVYVALFGDPKLNLPEGRGLFPAACLGRNYSAYRVYVPNCRTSAGSLGPRDPYVYGELTGKVGLWCHENDYICGSTILPWNYGGHLTYAERMAQLVGILRGRLPYHTATRAMNVESSGVFALLSSDTYYAHPGEEVVLDASPSFGLDIEIARYEWSVDGGEFESGDVTTTRSFADVGEHNVTVRVTDWLDSTAEYASKVVVTTDGVVAEQLPAPSDVVAERVGNEVVLDWGGAEVVAPYLWVRLDGFDLGFVEAAQKTLTISDVDFSENVVIEVAWLSEDAVSEWREVG